ACVRWRRVVHLALPAVVVFLVVNAFYLGVAQSNGYPYFSSLTWSRWDTGWYVKIARFGYDIYSCKRMGLDPATYCGASGWFPGFPAAMWMLMRLGAHPKTAGTIVATAFELATLLL